MADSIVVRDLVKTFKRRAGMPQRRRRDVDDAARADDFVMITVGAFVGAHVRRRI